MMNQPLLEDALNRSVEATGGIRMLRGHDAVQLKESEDQVDVVTQDHEGFRHYFRAPWLIGCDGANSFVRAHMPTEMIDLGLFL